MQPHRPPFFLRTLAGAVLATVAAGCTTLALPDGPARKETVVAVTTSNQLIRFNAGLPAQLLSSRTVTGLQPGETVLGMDFRVSKGWLYALGSTSRLYRIHPTTGVATAVGEPLSVPLAGNHFGVDFNPVADRIRLVSDTGQNLRLHPDTGAVVDSDAQQAGVQPDGPLAYAPGDIHATRTPQLVAAACTYNKQDEKLTTNYALDATAGALVTQGSREGTAPVVSPNAGQLFTVGTLGAGTFGHAAFDIADVSGAAFAALTTEGAATSRWVLLDLATGKAHGIGSIGGSEAIIAMAIEP